MTKICQFKSPDPPEYTLFPLCNLRIRWEYPKEKNIVREKVIPYIGRNVPLCYKFFLQIKLWYSVIGCSDIELSAVACRLPSIYFKKSIYEVWRILGCL